MLSMLLISDKTKEVLSKREPSWLRKTCAQYKKPEVGKLDIFFTEIIPL